MAQPTSFRLALAQIDPTVGDVEGNVRLISESIADARDAGAQLIVLPELCVSGYPPEDLLLRRDFLATVREGLDAVAAGVHGIVALAGFPERVERSQAELERFNPLIDPPPPPAYNSLAVLADGEIQGIYRKCDLPNYGVFDERRYFEPGCDAALIEVDGVRVGLTVCEDIWHPGFPERDEAAAGAGLIVNASASPYHRGKGRAREGMVVERARTYGAAFALCNTVGGQDELVFDGGSVVIAPDGEVLARAAEFEPELLVCDLTVPAPTATDGAGAAREVRTLAELTSGADTSEAVEPRIAEPIESEEAEVYAALELGLRDYVQKNGFEHVVVALSGGIDSALVALIAADALGPEHVTVVVMPSPNSSDATQADAQEDRRQPRCGVDRDLHPGGHGGVRAGARTGIRGRRAGARGGEHPGAHPRQPDHGAVQQVRLARSHHRQQERALGRLRDALRRHGRWLRRDQGRLQAAGLPARPVAQWPGGPRADPGLGPRASPSAELRPDQLDEDSLPPYEVLDRILEAYVERDEGIDALVGEGLPEDTVMEVVRLVDRAEYKRRQAPPGIRVSTKAFGRDRRLPITNRFGSMRPLPR